MATLPACGDDGTSGTTANASYTTVTAGDDGATTDSGATGDGAQTTTADPGESSTSTTSGADTGTTSGADAGTTGTGTGGTTGGTTGGVAGECGNGIKEPGEECDDGNQNNEDPCNSDCTNARCGDGNIHRALGEFCDDGNAVDGDACNNDCQDGGLWTKTYDGTAHDNDSLYGVATDSANNIIAVGSQFSTTENDNIFVRKLDPDGNELWTRTVHVLTADIAYGVAVDSGNNIIVVGSSFTQNDGRDIWIRKYDSGGTAMWTRTHNGPNNDTDEAFGVAVDGSDAIIVAGYEDTAAEDRNAWVRKYDSGGTEQWTRTHNGPANGWDQAQAVAVDGSGNVYVAGWEFVTGQARNVWVQRYASNGTPGWSRTYNGAMNGNDEGWGVATDTPGNVVVAGFEPVAGQDIDVWLRKYDSTGTEVWTRGHNGRSDRNDYGRAVTTDSNDNVIIAGSEYLAGGNQDNIWARGYDASGAVVWNWEYWGPAGATDSARGVATDGADAVVVVGYETRSDINQKRNMWIRKHLQ